MYIVTLLNSSTSSLLYFYLQSASLATYHFPCFVLCCFSFPQFCICYCAIVLTVLLTQLYFLVWSLKLFSTSTVCLFIRTILLAGVHLAHLKGSLKSTTEHDSITKLTQIDFLRRVGQSSRSSGLQNLGNQASKRFPQVSYTVALEGLN